MQILHSLSNPQQQPLALTIGNFDGVHLGHQTIVRELVNMAQKNQLTPAAMTFSPHAKALFGDCTNYLISSETEKAYFLQHHGIKKLYQIPFNQAFSQIAAEEFITLLVHQLQVKYLLVGDDFRFGHHGQGDFNLLTKKSQGSQMVVQNTPTVDLDGKRISSSRVRAAIKQGNFNLAKRLLGYSPVYTETVVADKQLGRKINFPTANLRFPSTRLLPYGVFAIQAHLERHPETYQGMCNIGTKPTVTDQAERQIEAHLFNFSEDIYGKVLTIKPIAKIRDEITFSGIDALTQQLHRDKQHAINLLDKYSTVNLSQN